MAPDKHDESDPSLDIVRRALLGARLEAEWHVAHRSRTAKGGVRWRPEWFAAEVVEVVRGRWVVEPAGPGCATAVPVSYEEITMELDVRYSVEVRLRYDADDRDDGLHELEFDYFLRPLTFSRERCSEDVSGRLRMIACDASKAVLDLTEIRLGVAELRIPFSVC